MNVRDAMTKNVQAVERGSTLSDAVRIMRDANCGVVPVLESHEDGRLCGIVTDRDCALQAFEREERLSDIPVADAMSTDLVTCSPDDSMERAEKLMAKAQVRRLPVVDDDGKLQGILATADVARESEKDEQHKARVGGTMAGISKPK